MIVRVFWFARVPFRVLLILFLGRVCVVRVGVGLGVRAIAYDFLEGFISDGVEAVVDFILCRWLRVDSGACLVFLRFSRFVDGWGGFRCGVFGFGILIRLRLDVF